MWEDDDGQFSPLGTTLFWAPRGWKFERARVEQHFAFIAPYVDYYRALGEVGWQDRTPDGSVFIDPEWPDYEQNLADMIDCGYDDYGLRVEVTAVGGASGRDYLALARKLANVAKGREHKIIHFEAVNEFYNNNVSASEARAVADILAGTGILTAISSPAGGAYDEIKALMAGMRATVATAHLDRGTTQVGGWRQCKQAWDLRDLPYLTSQNEPPGPTSSGGQNNDPLQLAMMRAHGALCGLGAYVLHVGAGVTGQVNPAYGRPANIWEPYTVRELPGQTFDNIEAIFQAVRNVEQLIPKGVENWKRTNTWWADNPLRADLVWTDDPGNDHGVVQLQTAYNNQGQFVSMPLGIKQFVSIKAVNACVVELGEPTTGAILATTRLAAGESFTLDGPERGGLGAYILLGNGAR